MMVPRPDNQSTCEGEICLNIGRSYAGVSEGQGQAGVNHNNRGVLFDPTQHGAGQLDPA